MIDALPLPLALSFGACLACPLCWSMALSALALWLLLPGGSGPTRAWHARLGWCFAAAAFVLLGVYVPRISTASTALVFWPLAALTAGSAVAAVSMRSPAYCALWFAVLLLGVAGLFMLQGAQFLGVATVVVYAGAIVVTFLFVLMLAQPQGQAFYDRISWGALPLAGASLLAAGIVGGITFLAVQHDAERPPQMDARLPTMSALAKIVGDDGAPLIDPQDVLAASLFTDGPARILHLTLNDRGPGQLLSVVHAEARLAAAFDHPPEAFRVVAQLQRPPHGPNAPRHVMNLGAQLFSTHLTNVEIAGTLLLAALVGAVAIVAHGRDRAAIPAGGSHG